MYKKVRLPGGYAIVQQGALCDCGNILRGAFNAGKIAVITDENVFALYGGIVQKSLSSAGFAVYCYAVAAGERSKNLDEYCSIMTFLAKNEFTGSDTVMTLGGGVCGDLGGFVAATYQRGIRLVSVPTTLLAAIDSSVGGKAAVNLPQGKNLVGAFKQPEVVLCDVDCFSSLTKNEYDEGLGELCKYSLLTGKEFDVKNINKEDTISDIVLKCINYKAKIVKKDPYDKGLRRILNLGHTVAHAIESDQRYAVPHGIAVFYGIKRIVEVCFKNGIMPEKEYMRCKKIISSYPVSTGNIDIDVAIKKYLVSDKKRSGDNITMVLLRAAGKPFLRSFKLKEAEELLCR